MAFSYLIAFSQNNPSVGVLETEMGNSTLIKETIQSSYAQKLEFQVVSKMYIIW